MMPNELHYSEVNWTSHFSSRIVAPTALNAVDTRHLLPMRFQSGAQPLILTSLHSTCFADTLRLIAQDGNCAPMDSAHDIALENAIRELQLYGSSEQYCTPVQSA